MLFALGSNGSGQLGIGHTEDVATPTEVQLPEELQSCRLLRIAAGGNHTLLLFENGKLHSFGDDCDGRFREIEKDSLKNTNRTTLSGSTLSSTRHYLQVAATWQASIVVVTNDCSLESGKVSEHPDEGQSQRHQVLTAGIAMRGELGRPQKLNDHHFGTLKGLPTQLEVVDIAACMNHVVVILSNGDVYGWGAGRKGQLGEPKQDIIDRPRKLAGIPFRPQRVACGKEFTYIVGPPTTGEHIILGVDKWQVVSNAPGTAREWKDISASWGSIFVLLESGAVLSWGRNDHGQLCPPNIPKIRQLVAGSEHVVALTEDRKVVVWGWGEHGNCGLPVDGQGDVKGRWNELSVPGTVDCLGAGCATTFISTLSAGEGDVSEDD